jgi:hypothetical protein
MKTCNSAMIVIAALGSLTAQANVAGMAGTWNGTGTSYTLTGDNQGDYAVQITDTLQADGSILSSVEVAIPGNASKQYEMQFKDSGKGFTMSSAQGSGGATCLERGLCEGYFGDSSGNGVAITIIVDDANHYRSLKTELQGYRATGFALEKYTRAQTR